MKHIQILLSLLLFSLFTGNLPAQKELTDNQKKIFQQRIKQKVDEFQSSLSSVVDKKLSHQNRSESVTNLFKLFMGKGEAYSYYDEDLDRRVNSTGVKIQTSSTNRAYSSSQKLKSYIYKLYDPATGKSKMNYEKIVIESADAVRVDNIQKSANGNYECVAYFTQKFIGYRDGKITYSDKTSKKIRCYIIYKQLPSGKEIFEAFLGDIYVLSTKKL